VRHCLDQLQPALLLPGELWLPRLVGYSVECLAAIGWSNIYSIFLKHLLDGQTFIAYTPKIGDLAVYEVYDQAAMIATAL